MSQEYERNEGIRDWIRGRIQTAQNAISAHDILRHFGVSLRKSGSDHEEQFSCPFHGNDTKPSARVYPASSRSPSGVWCFVCNERWDIFKLWQKFKGGEDKFTAVLFQMEREFGVTVPEGPEYRPEDKPPPDAKDREEVESLYQLCENRLRLSKRAFSMQGFLIVGSLLDRVRYHLDHGIGDLASMKISLCQILDKIGEKERQS